MPSVPSGDFFVAAGRREERLGSPALVGPALWAGFVGLPGSPDNDGREVLDAADEGGGIEALLPTPARDLAAEAGVRATVDNVREWAGFANSCFVGDFVGDC